METIKRIPYKEWCKIHSRVPRLCVDLVIEKNGVLLTKRGIKPWKGMWHTPGGSVMYGETLEQAARRIAKNELGVGINLGKQMNRTVEYIKPSIERGGHAVSIYFKAKIKKGQKIKLNGEATEYAYFKEIPARTISEQKRFLTR